MEGGASANGAAAALEEPANGQQAAGGSSNGEGGSPAAANEALGGSCHPPRGSSNEGRGGGGSTNEQPEGREAAGEAANEEGGGRQGSANGGAGKKDPTNESAGCQGPANERAEPPEPGLQPPANQDAAPDAPTNEEAAPPGLTNQDAAPHAPANEDSGLQAPANERAALPDPATGSSGGGAEPSNENRALPTPTNGSSGGGAEPSNELAALPAPTNGRPDPWDWASEEAWLRVRVGEGREEEEEWGEGGEEEEEWAWPEEGACPEAGEGWWVSPDSAFSKRVVRKGRGLGRPGRGSRCRVRVEAPPPWGGWVWPGAGPGGGGWGTVRVGEGAGRWAGLLDACLESMGEGEGAWLRPEGAGLKAGAGLRVRLGRFTAPPPWWEEPVGGEGRWAEVRAWQEGAESFLRAGWAEPAARAYRRALRLAIAAGGAPPPFLGPAQAEGREGEGWGGRKAELHAGLALCQLRLGLPAPAATNAGKALALRPGHLEARYRRGVAAAAMRDLEAAAADLGQVLREEPSHGGARRELRRVRGEARERDARLARRLGRLFA